MNIQEYISSGIVESYVLGLADKHESAEFERMCELHPEVRSARESFELSLEEQAGRNQLSPPPTLKNKIFSAIELEQHSAGTGKQATIPPVSSEIRIPAGKNEVGVLRPMQGAFQRFVAVAAVILLVLSTALNVYFFNRYREYNERYEALLASQSQLATNNQLMQTRLLEYERAVEMMKDPAMAIVRMPATEASPDPASATIVLWDTNTKDVYLTVNKLPQPTADQQYQLWALVDGKPVDAGVFDLTDATGVIKMKNIPRAQAFAITLERRGGSATPSMDKLYVMGKV